MLRIAYTSPQIHSNESDYIRTVIDSGWDFVHLRHPGATCEEYRRILDTLGEEYRRRIRLHAYFDLAEEYGLAGIHLNSRFPTAPAGYRGDISRSLHHREELDVKESTDVYVTLSPFFPSISKTGYLPTLDFKTLKKEIIDYPSPVIALGGITPENCVTLEETGVAGYAVLGYLAEARDNTDLLRRLKQFH